MPMIDVYSPSDMFSEDADRPLALALTQAVMAAEGFEDPVPKIVQSVTGFYMHRLPASAVHTARTANARVVRVHIQIGTGGLDAQARTHVVKAVTEFIARHAMDPRQELRTFVIISEALEGGWGIAGETYGKAKADAFFALGLE